MIDIPIHVILAGTQGPAVQAKMDDWSSPFVSVSYRDASEPSIIDLSKRIVIGGYRLPKDEVAKIVDAILPTVRRARAGRLAKEVGLVVDERAPSTDPMWVVRGEAGRAIAWTTDCDLANDIAKRTGAAVVAHVPGLREDALTKLAEMDGAPPMHALCNEAWLSRVATILEMAIPGYEATWLYHKHLDLQASTPGRGPTDKLDVAWARGVLEDAARVLYPHERADYADVGVALGQALFGRTLQDVADEIVRGATARVR